MPTVYPFSSSILALFERDGRLHAAGRDTLWRFEAGDWQPIARHAYGEMEGTLTAQGRWFRVPAQPGDEDGRMRLRFADVFALGVQRKELSLPKTGYAAQRFGSGERLVVAAEETRTLAVVEADGSVACHTLAEPAHGEYRAEARIDAQGRYLVALRPDACEVACTSLADGRRVWTHRCEDGLHRQLVLGRDTAFIVERVHWQDSYFSKLRLTALALADGTPRWSQELDADNGTPVGGHGSGLEITAGAGAVWAPYFGDAVGWDELTGKEVFRQPHGMVRTKAVQAFNDRYVLASGYKDERLTAPVGLLWTLDGALLGKFEMPKAKGKDEWGHAFSLRNGYWSHRPRPQLLEVGDTLALVVDAQNAKTYEIEPYTLAACGVLLLERGLLGGKKTIKPARATLAQFERGEVASGKKKALRLTLQAPVSGYALLEGLAQALQKATLDHRFDKKIEPRIEVDLSSLDAATRAQAETWMAHVQQRFAGGATPWTFVAV